MDDGTEIVNPNLILNAQQDFYKKLYESKTDSNSTNDNFFLHGDSIPILDDVDSNKCEGKLTISECYNVLSKMSKNKSPGNDGLSCEWYLFFWNVIGDFLVNVLNFGLSKGELSLSQKQAVITLIEKEGKDRCKLKNWRPISLLNVDYKIASKALAMRVEKIIHKLINTDQSGFVKGRFIGESVRTIQDIMDFTKQKNIPGLLLFLDFEKAFDSLEWSFLFETLKIMNFGPDFIKYVKSLYTNISSCVLNNGLTSTYFPIGRGVRQGDPLSSYLFILAIELLSCKIREDPSITGIQIAGSEINLIQYADDTTCVLDGVQSANHLLNLLDKFTMVSGLKLNVTKSQAMWLGSMRNSNHKPLNVQWPTDPIKALGVYFSYNDNAAENMNFVPKLKQVKTLLNIWRMRNLTLAGKILLIKTFALSKFIYLASVVHIPDAIIQELEKTIYKFLWNGGNGFIKKTTIIGDLAVGGLKMIDLKSSFAAQKTKWINFYFTTSAPWKLMFDSFFAPYGGNLIFHCNLDIQYIKSNMNVPIFYKDMLISHITLTNPDSVSPLHQCIWNNRHVCINKKPCFYQYFFDSGIRLVSDFFETDGAVIPFETWIRRGLHTRYYLQWMGILSAIPNSWKLSFRQGFNREQCTLVGLLFLDNDGSKYDVRNMTSRCIYNVLVKRIFKPPTSENKFADEYHINNNEWNNIYLMPFKCTVDVRTRLFQYKINLNCLMTNSRLHKMKLVDNAMCTFCNNHIESLKHLFWDCTCVGKIWSDFKTWYDIMTDSDITLNYKNIIFCCISNTLMNLCLILMKKVIYSCRFSNQRPTLVMFKNQIIFHYKLEKQISLSNGTMHKFIHKWNYLQDFCTKNN